MKARRTMETNLLPCPFCGGEAISFSEDAGWDLYGNNEYRAYAGCHNEGCGIGFELYHTGDDLFDEDIDDTPDGITCKALELQAVEAWNTRAERTCRVTGSSYDELLDEVYTDLSCGHWTRLSEREVSYCPKCGAKREDER